MCLPLLYYLPLCMYSSLSYSISISITFVYKSIAKCLRLSPRMFLSLSVCLFACFALIYPADNCNRRLKPSSLRDSRKPSSDQIKSTPGKQWKGAMEGRCQWMKEGERGALDEQRAARQEMTRVDVDMREGCTRMTNYIRWVCRNLKCQVFADTFYDWKHWTLTHFDCISW